MPPKTRKRKASATGEFDWSLALAQTEFLVESNLTEDVAPKRATRAPRKPTTGAGRQQRGKNATSVANEVPRLSIDVAASKKRKILVGDAKKQIQNQGNDLIKYISTELKARPNRVEKNVLKSELSADLTSVLAWMNPTVESQDGTVQNFPQLMLKALDELQSYVETYETLVEQDSGIRAPTWMRWEQDAKDLGELGKHGLNMASKIINHIIMPDLHTLPTKPEETASDIEKVAWDLIEDAVPDKSEQTWGKAAQGQVKVFAEVLKMAPDRE
ncbi:60s ribosomal l15 [Fusarium albosuccineum]|uniref:60s ribosomal l15 n=1 Tax=Fusarium albosuccineum TaxID=1237068 RepID=A0A8H4L1Z8_9HYPO|nr:60s ribosomal l15 [Fusarium albosuccineum]